jgi:hypothetical protein
MSAALVVARMSWVGSDDTYRTSWSRNEGEGDAIELELSFRTWNG